jgi:hypothetical protein
MQAGKTFTTYSSNKVIRSIAITWVITKLICYKLWLAGRIFPLIPVNDALAALPAFTHDILFVLSLCCMLLLVFFPNKRIAIVLLLAELLSCMLDQNRWQPWEYQFIFMLAGYVFVKDEHRIRFSWQLIIAGIFFFSGISKLNSAFIHDVWQNLMLRRWLGISPLNIWLVRAGYAIPLIEIVAGIGLLFNSTKRSSVWILVCMHFIILLMLGPTGLNINAVIWPWNILMPLLLFLVFYNGSFEFKLVLSPGPFTWLVLLCWWILPWLQLAGYWDKYLSSVLYSGGVEQLFICTNDPAAKKEMGNYFDKEFRVIPCSPVLSVYKWGIADMNTAPYPEPRIHIAIMKEWKKRFPNDGHRFYTYKPGFAYQVNELVQDAGYRIPDTR